MNTEIKCINNHINNIGAIFCNQCNILLPYYQTDLFTVINLPVPTQFSDLNLKEIQEQIISLQILLHPDNFIKEDVQAQINAQQFYNDLNEYMKISKSYHLMIEYVLKNGYNYISNEKHNDPQILFEIMTKNEQAETLSTKSEIRKFRKELQSEVENIAKGINFSDDLQTVHKHAQHIHYLERLKQRLKP